MCIRDRYMGTEKIQPHQEFGAEDDIRIVLDLTQDEKLKAQGLAREFTNKIQKLRKKAGLNVEDDVIVFYTLEGEVADTQKALKSEAKFIDSVIKIPLFEVSERQAHLVEVVNEVYAEEGGNETITISICHNAVRPNTAAVNARLGAQAAGAIQQLVAIKLADLKNLVKEKAGIVTVTVDGNQVELKEGQDFWVDHKVYRTSLILQIFLMIY
eukprot:TRINITY_DN2644_c0_g1_i6.p1 TRINITY_DN2644_c0_g1~~TRINITY_DN2644_c0_g1_i6.p1  ORF type:complete len:228 (-),score=98.18 TRINITY_DN2644_c0_g1_i6:265-900(-)